MQFRHAGRAAALTGAVALVAVGGSASAAYAADTAGAPEQIKTSRGSALFYDIDENLEARDLRKDGRGARAYLTWNGHTSSAHASGKDTRDVVDLNIPEGTTVYLKLCYTDNGRDVSCSATQKGVA